MIGSRPPPNTKTPPLQPTLPRPVPPPPPPALSRQSGEACQSAAAAAAAASADRPQTRSSAPRA
eukprot:9483742-Pyramimonas_sp.AAC.1